MTRRVAVGVVGVVCPAAAPLLALVALVAPAIARGNAVVVAPSQDNPLPGLAFSQVCPARLPPAIHLSLEMSITNVPIHYSNHSGYER